jgi:hypothetical protein
VPRGARRLWLFASLVTILVAAGVTVGVLASAGDSSPVRADAACQSDMRDVTNVKPATSAVRLTHEVQVIGDEFLPPPADFDPKTSAQLAWKSAFGGRWQVHGSYHLVLARVSYDTDGTGFRYKPFDYGQIIWLAVGTHLAFIPGMGPGPTHAAPRCLFGEVYNAVNATSGLGLDSAGGAAKGDHF